MPVSPSQYERFAVEVYRVYADAEVAIMTKVARRLARGIEQPGWAERKAVEIGQLRAETLAEIRRLRALDSQLATAVSEAYQSGAASAVLDLGQMGITGAVEGFGTVHRRAVDVLVRKLVDRTSSTHLRILREVEDTYRQAQFESSAHILTGTKTRVEATQDLLNRLADRGISGFVDRRGRSWDVASYAEMATRSVSGQAAIEGHINRLTENGYDLVIVSDSPEECPTCRPWEGKILSIGGTSQQYPSVATATAAGLFHPRCTHTLGAFIPGLTTVRTDTANPAGYEQRQEQRSNERMIRQWKRREAVAITPEAQQQAHAKVRAWQKTQRDFTAETGRRRHSQREQVVRGQAGVTPPRA